MKYRAYVIHQDQIERAFELDAAYDFEAVQLVSCLRPEGDELEVWHRARFVAKVDRVGDVLQGPGYIPRLEAQAGI